MIRKRLKAQEGQRKKFVARFTRFGKKVNYKGYSEMTVLLTEVTDAETKERVADHLWFAYTQGFEKAGIKEGDTVEFDARVKEYSKGYVNRALSISRKKTDYKLSNPTRIRVV
jgi:hypothetical protein